MLHLKIPATLEPMPLKQYLRQTVGISLTMWRKIKRTGTLLINGQPAAYYSIIQPNDEISLSWEEECDIKPDNVPLTICYEDDCLLIVEKPAGILVHPTGQKRTGTLANAVIHYLHSKNLVGSFHPVHRLDRNTSGLLIVAKFPHIQHVLGTLAHSRIQKYYRAIATGTLPKAQDVIDAPIDRKPGSIIERVVSNTGLSAVTKYTLLKPLHKTSFIELELLTGRTHQIRVHMAHIGHPLLGDDLYGGSLEFIQRQALHASRLVFNHPVSGQIIDISSPLPEDMSALLKQLTVPTN